LFVLGNKSLKAKQVVVERNRRGSLPGKLIVGSRRLLVRQQSGARRANPEKGRSHPVSRPRFLEINHSQPASRLGRERSARSPVRVPSQQVLG
jgi:hypothetical protein